MVQQITEAKHVWHNGALIPWADATVHVLSSGVQFGSSVFEGIRCYETASGAAVFSVFVPGEGAPPTASELRKFRETAALMRALPGLCPR